MDFQKLIEKFKEHWKIAGGALAALLVAVGFLLYSHLQQTAKPDQLASLAVQSSQSISHSLEPSSKSATEKSTAEESASPKGKIVVDVKGAVNKPQVYEVDPNLRVYDVIQLAGGFAANADQNSINLAAKISDAEIIYVATVDEKAEAARTAASSLQATDVPAGSSGSTSAGKVNINTADLTALQTLTGIGQKKAQDIIDYRTKNGPFKSIDDLANVSGFGEKTLEKLKDSISVN